MIQYHKEFRCQECKKLMFKGTLVDSEVEVKCKKCGQLNLFQGKAAAKYICLVESCPGRVALPQD